MISALAKCLEQITQCHCHSTETFTCKRRSIYPCWTLARTPTRIQGTVLCDGWLTIALGERHSRVFTIVAGIWAGCKPQRQLGVPKVCCVCYCLLCMVLGMNAPGFST